MFVADTDGFVKILSDKKTDRVLGAHMIGSVNILLINYWILINGRW